MKILYILGCVAFTVFGQILVKKGAVQLKGVTNAWSYVMNLYILNGLLFAFFAAASWIKALQYYKLSYAYPFMSLSFFLVAILSVWIFGETMKLNQWVGLIILLIGLFIGSR